MARGWGWLALVFWALLGSAAAQAPAPSTPAAAPASTLRIATEGANPPFNFIGPGFQLQGFEVDLGRALCEAMGVTCTFVRQDWDEMAAGLNQNRYDAVMSSMAITQERRQRYTFSKRYYQVPMAFLGRKDTDITSVLPADLAGKSVGTPARSETATLLEERYPDTTLKTFDKLEDANLDLLTGRLDLVLGDKLALSRFLESREGSGCCRFVADLPRAPEYLGEGVAVALRKGDKQLRDRFDMAIDKVQADGTYDRIRAKYFPFDIK